MEPGGRCRVHDDLLNDAHLFAPAGPADALVGRDVDLIPFLFTDKKLTCAPIKSSRICHCDITQKSAQPQCYQNIMRFYESNLCSPLVIPIFPVSLPNSLFYGLSRCCNRLPSSKSSCFNSLNFRGIKLASHVHYRAAGFEARGKKTIERRLAWRT